MNRYEFSAARAVFYPVQEAERDRRENAVTHYGFYHSFICADVKNARIRIAARNVYRLYLNGEMIMHGPARTAHGYARVDSVEIGRHLKNGVNHIAVEVVVYGGDFYKSYSNDCTLEAGLLTAELEVNDEVLSASGRDDWQVCRLKERDGCAERISHSRECAEVCRLTENRTDWRRGVHPGFVSAEILEGEPVYLERRSLLPTLEKHPFSDMIGFGACRIDPEVEVVPEFWNHDSINPKGYYDRLPAHPLKDCRQTVEYDGSVTAKRTGSEIQLSGGSDKYVLCDMGENCVGFIGVEFTAEREGIVDIAHSEWLELDGTLSFAYNTVTRIYVPAGRTAFVTMEPAIARYLKLYFRGTGDVTVREVFMREYTVPDEHRSAFLCSDGDINRLYRAAKKSLVLNTLDIFMDCPDRERGGWLCDSLWTARAAAMMLSDARVERDFIENFLLTPAEGMSNAFFPEVYPGSKPNYPEDTGISTWSFWLMCELCEYVRRTGDRRFAEEHGTRVEAFVNGSGSFIGSSGLIERLEGVYIDGSLSNRREYQDCVSTPANALYAYVLCELGALYHRADWIERGEGMRRILRKAIAQTTPGGLNKLTTFPDHWTKNEDGSLIPGGNTSESGMATALWSGLFERKEVPALVQQVRDCMGPAPKFPANPYIGKSGLFIGLCIRMDMLCRLGLHEQMFEDMKSIYMPQLKEGPGTLWEHSVIDSSSRCHGFNGHAGVHLMRDVLGMGIPVREEGGRIRLRIAPHLCGLRWAKGTMELPEGIISVHWKYDGDSFELVVHVPEESIDRFIVEISLPREAKALDANRVCVRCPIVPA